MNQQETSHKVAVNNLFKALRKQGFNARQNLECCSSCACARIAQDFPKGSATVYYHRQDADSFKDGRLVHPLHLRYVEAGNGEQSAEEAAKGILRAAAQVGLLAVWSGSTDETVQIYPNPF